MSGVAAPSPWIPIAVGVAMALGLSACSRDTANSESTARTDSAPAGHPPPGGGATEAGRAAATMTLAAAAPMARADLRPTEGNKTSGVVEFGETADGTLEVNIELAELPPGKHGLHVHMNGDCSSPDASSAGAHFSPDARAHGSPTDAVHHEGDLGNVTADTRGIVVTKLTTPDMNLDGRNGVIDRAIIVHIGEDDLRSQPSGNSGDPIACGVVRRLDAARPRG